MGYALFFFAIYAISFLPAFIAVVVKGRKAIGFAMICVLLLVNVASNIKFEDAVEDSVKLEAKWAAPTDEQEDRWRRDPKSYIEVLDRRVREAEGAKDDIVFWLGLPIAAWVICLLISLSIDSVEKAERPTESRRRTDAPHKLFTPPQNIPFGRICPACGTVNPTKVKWCSSCPAQIPEGAKIVRRAHRQPRQPRQSPGRICPACGAVNEPQVKWCSSCPAQIPDNAEFAQQQSRMPPATPKQRYLDGQEI